MIDLNSFGENINAVIIGSSGGIGEAFTNHLIQNKNVAHIYALSRSKKEFDAENVTSGHIDLADESSIRKAAENIGKSASVDLVIVAAGLLHDGDLQPEKALKDLSPDSFQSIFKINAFGPALAAKYFLPLLPREGKSVFAALSARVGSIEDNHIGGWYSYRASKAALNMILKSASIEMARKYKEACVIGLQPGTVDTNLSEPFQGHVKPEKLFTPEYATEQMLSVINDIDASKTGKLIAYDGEVIPY